jgi:hypothetical protein
VIKPVELIAKSRRRLALIAAINEAVRWSVPAVVSLVLAALLPSMGRITWERAGYEVSADALAAIRWCLLAVSVGAFVTGVVRAWLAVKQTAFVEAAARIDRLIGAKEEVLTLAILSEPGSGQIDERSSLFPVLWRHVARLLESFDPDRVFHFDLVPPLRRSSVAALAVVLGLAIMTLVLMRVPSPMELSARKLMELANSIASEPGGAKLANEITAVANTLRNPHVRPEAKVRQLAALMKKVEQQQERQQEAERQGTEQRTASSSSPPSAMAQAGSSASGSGSSTSSKGNGAGSSNGGSGSLAKGEAGKGNGSSRGEGNGNGSGKGSSQASVAINSSASSRLEKSSASKSGSQSRQLMELQQQLAKAQAQVEMQDAKTPGPRTAQGGNGGNGKGPGPGANGNQQLASNQRNGSGPGSKPDGTMGRNPEAGQGKNGGPKVPGGNQGDTHLGEMPAPMRYERYYKPGESGPVLDIHDARFVLFRVPAAVPGPAGGKLSVARGGERATTPYVNVPLSEAHLDVPPDERQLVPPRYRELIH